MTTTYYFLFLALALMRTVSDSETSCYENTLQKEQLWKVGIRSISVNRGYKGLNTLYTYPTIKRGTLHTYLYTLASNVELNPGPRTPKYPCQICHRAITWGQKGVSCDDCNLWYHAELMHMSSHIYNCLNNISWNCVTCGMPQFTSSFFDSLDIHMQISFCSIASEDSIGPPDACSSPKAAHQRGKQKVTQPWNKFTLLNFNFQSIKNKTAEKLNIIDSYNPSIIIGTETWLNDSVHNSEIFPPNYNIYRRDRKDGFGGVLVAVKADIVSDHLGVEINTESVYISITLEKGKQLIVGALYRPNSSIEYMDNMCTTFSGYEGISTFLTSTGPPNQLMETLMQSQLIINYSIVHRTVALNKWSNFQLNRGLY